MFDAKATDYHVFQPDVQQECPEPAFSAGDWPRRISVRTACDVLLHRVSDVPEIWQTVLSLNLGYARFDQKIVYLERRSYLQSLRGACETWLIAIQLRFPVPNEMSVACQQLLRQQLLHIIDDHLQSLNLWLQTLPEHDQRELTGTTPPNQQKSEWYESDQDIRLESLRHKYHQNREQSIDPKIVEELKDDDQWLY